MPFIVRIDRGRRQAAFRLRAGHMVETGSLFHGPRTSSCCDRLNTNLTVSFRRDVSEDTYGVYRLHKHLRVGNLASEEVIQCLFIAPIVAGL
jgi:hypothetical protein